MEVSRRWFAAKLATAVAGSALIVPAFPRITLAAPIPDKEIEPKSFICPIYYWHEVPDDKVMAFERDISYFLLNNYYPIAVRDAAYYLSDGIQTWPQNKKPVILSFDDGRLSQHRNALPVLKKNYLQATFFVMPDYKRDDYMTNEHFVEIRESGREIAAHTFTHPHLPSLRLSNNGDWQAQIIQPKRRLEEIIGEEVISFAYTFGRNGVDPETIALASKHYKIAVTTGGDHNYPILRSNEIFTLPRFSKDYVD